MSQPAAARAPPLDERAAALGATRSQLIIQAVEQALEDRSAWSPGFLKALGTRVPSWRRPWTR